MQEDCNECDVNTRIMQLLRDNSIRVVAFDMDQTAVALHSRGRLKREKLPQFLEKATSDFISLVPDLHKHGFGLSIATHSDEKEFATGRQALLIDPKTHIMGEELAKALLDHCFTPDIVSSFFIVAHNPRAHGQGKDPQNCIKRYHMREIQNHFSVEGKEILFFDDTPAVVDDCANRCGGVRAVLVDPKKGFQLGNLLKAFSPMSSVANYELH